MPRRDREFDDDPPTPAKGGFPLWLILALSGLGVCVLACGGVGVLTFAMYKRDMARQQETADQERQRMNQELSHLRKLEAERNREILEQEAKAREVARDRASQVNYRRDDFRSRVLGRTEDELRDLFGHALPPPDLPPDEAQLKEPTENRLVYLARTYQTDPQVLDREVVIVFRNGRAAEVLFR